MAIEKFTPADCTIVRKEMEAALAAVEAKFGLKIQIGKITYDETSFSAKLSCVAGEGAETDGPAKWVINFNRGYFPGLTLGQVINYGGEKLTIVGARPRAKANIILKRPDGKYTAVPSEVLRKVAAK